MRRTFFFLFFLMLLAAGGLFMIYVSSGNAVCDRIERGSEVVKWGSNAIKFAAKPWISDDAYRSIHVEGVKMRLRFAGFLQAYNSYVQCPWDVQMQRQQNSKGANP